jgi:hypothetical protein
MRDTNPRKTHSINLQDSVAALLRKSEVPILYCKTTNLKKLNFSRDDLKKLKCVGDLSSGVTYKKFFIHNFMLIFYKWTQLQSEYHMI